MSSMSFAPPWWHAFLPARTAIGRVQRWRAAIGAVVGVGLAGLAGVLAHLPAASLPFLVAPMGASAVLLFCLPASPLAQPWSVIGGNLVSGAIGIACARLVPLPLAAAMLSMGLAILAMLALRCLHPPSGAMALVTSLGGPAVQAAGFSFLVWPVTLNGLVLVAVAIAWNRATGHRYPHGPRLETSHPQATRDASAIARLGFTAEDLRQVLREHDEMLDISEDDLEAVFLRTERLAHRRRFGETRCEHLMSRDVVTVEFGTPLDEAWALLRNHHVPTVPVVDRARRVIGVLSREDFVRGAAVMAGDGWGARLSRLLHRTPELHSDKPEVVGQVMARPPETVRASTPLVELVALMTDADHHRHHHHVPVVGDDDKLVGMVAPTDVIAALYEAGLAELG